MNLKATMRHHSISSARVVDLGTDDLATAKRKATAEFGSDHSEYELCILGEPTIHNPSGIIATRRLDRRKWVMAE